MNRLALLVAVALAATAASACADTLIIDDVPPASASKVEVGATHDLSAGQTFTTDALHTNLTQFEFYGFADGPDSIFNIATFASGAPGASLFSVSVAARDRINFGPLVINTGGLILASNTTYIAYLQQHLPSNGSLFLEFEEGGSAYAGGANAYQVDGGTWISPFIISGLSGPNQLDDLAFKATLDLGPTAAPLPSTLFAGLPLLALVPLLLLRRRGGACA